MKAALFTSNVHFPKKVVSEFFQFGITVYQFDQLKYIYGKIIDFDLDCIFLDTTRHDLDWVKFVRLLKSRKKTEHINIIIYTDAENMGILKEMVLWGINGVFETHNPPLSTYVDKIQEVVNLLESETKNKRKFVRITPDKDETLRAELKMEKHTVSFRGLIKDLSVVSAAINFSDNSLIEHLNVGEGESIEAILEVGSIPYSVSAKLIRAVDNTVVIEYINPSFEFKESLIDYIFHKVNI